MKSATAMLIVALAIAGPLHALSISPKVSALVIQARTLSKAGKHKAALAKLHEADTVKSTPDDTAAINQMKQYVETSRPQP